MKTKMTSEKDPMLLMESATALKLDSVTGVVRECITHDQDYLSLIRDTVKMFGAVGGTSRQLFAVLAPDRNDGTDVLSMLPEGAMLVDVLQRGFTRLGHFFPNHKFHPAVVLFKQLVELSPITLCLAQPDAFKWTGNFPHEVKCLNDLVAKIREHSRSVGYRTAVKSFQRVASKNKRSLLRYRDALFRQYSRLLVLRLDLGYHHDVSRVKHDQAPFDAYTCVRENRIDFFKYLNKAYRKSLVGFNWRLEYALQKGFHYHLILYFDGSKVREDVTIGRLLGQHWDQVITHGMGVHFNCNASARRYRRCGIGMLKHNDAESQAGLALAVSYITKPDIFLQAVFPANARVLGRGNMPFQKGAKRGAPRALA